jgi:hypothetical protein
VELFLEGRPRCGSERGIGGGSREKACESGERKFEAIVLVPARIVKSIVKLQTDSSRRGARLANRQLSAASALVEEGVRRLHLLKPLPNSLRADPSPASFPVYVYTTQLSHASANNHMRHLN